MNKALIAYLRQHFSLDWHGIHGANHWARVKKNGLYLCRQHEADEVVVELFAFLHDSERLYEDSDPGHGERAARLVESMQGEFFTLSDVQLYQLTQACALHSSGAIKHNDVTVMTCWDADRLDLGRVGVMPKASFLCTDAAKDPTFIEWCYLKSLPAKK